MAIMDITGQRFFRLVVLHTAGRSKSRSLMWKCLCDCGKTTRVVGSALRRGDIQSCGCHNSRRTLPPGESGFNRLLSIYIASAKKRNLVFKLTESEFETLTQGNCFYCGINPSTITQHPQLSSAGKQNACYVYNGIDRVDNTKGYTVDNCVSCCTTCNLAKSEKSADHFLTWLRRIVAFRYSNGTTTY